MHLESKQSQFRPGESQRSKNVPDVLFVDEDGNPIEAGAENLIYIDEAGNEVPEELAIRLLESGKYIDSRLLYDEDMIRRSNSYASSGLMGSNSQAVFNASKGSTLGTQSDYQQSTKHSSSYISKQSNYESKQSSYDSKPSSYATSKRSSSYNTVAQQAQLQSQLQTQAQEMARVQAQLFAEAHAQAQAKAEEIAQIEADAQSNYGGSTINTEKHTPTVSADSKSSSQTTVNRTTAPSTDRRLPTVPPVKQKTESYAEELADFDSYIDEEERKMSQSTNKSSVRDPRSSTQKSAKSSQEKKLSMKEQVAKQKEGIQHNLIKNQLLKKQQELMEQQELERKQQEIIARQQQGQQKSRTASHHHHHHHQHHEPSSHSRNEIPSVVSRVSALSTDQRSSRTSGQSGVGNGSSRYSAGSSTVTGTSSSRGGQTQNQSSGASSSRGSGGSTVVGGHIHGNSTKTTSRLSELSRVSESSRGTNGPAGSGSSHQMTLNRSVSNHHHHHHSKQTPKVTAHLPVPYPPQVKQNRAAAAKLARTLPSETLSSTNMPAMRTNREFSNNYDILQMRQVGQLSGNKIIRNFSEANLSELENYYETDGDDAKGLEFEPTNLDIKPNHFIDPFSPDLFKDEIIDIDFGAIDAFTEALNAQITSEQNGQPPPKNLQFPSHILSSNHASFIDNQLLLGDSSINAGDGHSGINVQFLKPSNDSNTYYTSDHTGSTGANTATTSSAPTGTGSGSGSGVTGTDEASQYSHTNSFGSLIDVQKNRSQSTHDFNTTNRQSVLTSLDNLINATTSSRTASTRYSNSTYVR